MRLVSLSVFASFAALISAQTTTTDDFTATAIQLTFTKTPTGSASASAPASASASGSVTSSGPGSSGSSGSFTLPSSSVGGSSSVLYPNSTVPRTSSLASSRAAVSTVTDAATPFTPSSSSHISAATTLDSATASAILEQHNAKRSLHKDTPDLAWDDELSAFAYEYANSLKNTAQDPCSGVLVHSSNRQNQGENIAFGTTSDPNVLVDYWYDEIKYYDYNDITGIEHNGEEVGHFTQLVWASSSNVGCAVLQCDTQATYGQNSIYLICEYSPAGNVYDATQGQDEFSYFKSNVLPLKST
ncbi:LAFA_0G01332g1_1 [Lachancea sp. 'fantastica']|nr:LAFA_0G01332g1_1 [Lachancea sp. 'fantastica']